VSEHDDSERTICFCHCISQGEILAAIRAGAKSLEAIRAATRANTGCGGCEVEVQELLDQELAKESP
jgi:NAD(P)H-nitrite reductase large subunit